VALLGTTACIDFTRYVALTRSSLGRMHMCSSDRSTATASSVVPASLPAGAV